MAWFDSSTTGPIGKRVSSRSNERKPRVAALEVGVRVGPEGSAKACEVHTIQSTISNLPKEAILLTPTLVFFPPALLVGLKERLADIAVFEVLGDALEGGLAFR